MNTLEKDVESLREAHGQLSGQVSRFALLRILVLFIMVISFARGFERINSAEINKKQGEIEELKLVLKEQDDRIRMLEESLKQTDQPKPVEEISKAKADRRKANSDIKVRESEISELYRSAFRVKIPMPGAEPEIDLRTWIYSVPFLFILSEMFFYLQRKRLSLLSAVAAHLIKEKNPGKVSAYDRLLFEDDPARIPAFGRYPTRFIGVLHAVGLLALAVYFVIAGRPLWVEWDSASIPPIFALLLTTTFYAAAYCLRVSALLDAQVSAAFGLMPSQGVIRRLWEKGKQLARAALSRLKPDVSFTTGSLLVLSSLLLATSLDSCGNPHDGYDLVRGWAPSEHAEPSTQSPIEQSAEDSEQQSVPADEGYGRREEVFWPSGLTFVLLLRDSVRAAAEEMPSAQSSPGILASTTSSLGRGGYIAGLGLAVLTLILYPLYRRRSRSAVLLHLMRGLFVVTLSLTFYVIADLYFTLYALVLFSEEHPLYVLYLIPLWLLYWSAPIILLAWDIFARSAKIPERRRTARSFIIVLYTPVTAIAIVLAIFLVVGVSLFGFGGFLIGISLLTIGYREVVRTGGLVSAQAKSPAQRDPTESYDDARHILESLPESGGDSPGQA